MSFSLGEDLILKHEKADKKYRIYEINGVDIRFELADSFARQESVAETVNADMELFKSMGKLMTTAEIEIYQDVSANFPLREATLIRTLQLAENRLDALDVQKRQLMYIRKGVFREKYKIHLGAKDDIDGALLAYDRLYEEAVVQLNIQKNYVDYLRNTLPQYAFVDKRLTAKLQGSKWMKESLY